jgi:hypothetical protein
MLKTFFLTVGQKYRRETHPSGLHPDGWVEIEARTQDEAHEIAVKTFGERWSSLYPEEKFLSYLYPIGCVRRIENKNKNTP